MKYIVSFFMFDSGLTDLSYHVDIYARCDNINLDLKAYIYENIKLPGNLLLQPINRLVFSVM